ncbi:MAG: EAL domain-containing protein, partial [Pseudomonadales bacterium]
IHFAEQNGLVMELDLQMLRQAIQDFCEIADLNAKRWQLNVNASALSLNRRYIESLHTLIRGTALRSSQICIEVTETALADNYDEMLSVIKLLRQTGFHVALDDFGTGYSSLKYLRELGCDYLKLDRELVNDIGRDNAARALCKSAIDMAHVLDIAVIGEGVEDSDQLHLLEEMGCDFAQGYYLARPGDLSQIAFG